MKREKETALLERAGVEEKGSNWVEATKLYEQAAKTFLGKEMVGEAAAAYKKLGYACARAARTVETSEEYVELSKRAVEAYKGAANLFKKTGNRPEELECEAETIIVSGYVAGSVTEWKKACSQSHELFIESSEHYSKEGDRESLARTLSRAAIASSCLINYCSDRGEIEQAYQKGEEAADRAWRLSKDVGNVQSLAESLHTGAALSQFELWIVTWKGDERWREYFRKWLLRCDESLKLAEGCDDPLVLGTIYTAAGFYNGFFGFQFVEDEREQSAYFDKGLGLLEKASVFARKSKDKPLLIHSIFWLNWWSLVEEDLSISRKEYLTTLLSLRI